MRLAGQIKMGFYPTPPHIVDLIRGRLEFTGRFAALDPCAGEGSALAQLTADEDCRTYAIEPDGERYRDAAKALDCVLHSTIEEATISHLAFSLLYLNPPYDGEHEESENIAGERKTTRKEITFLKRCIPLLAPAGVLVFVVPRHVFTPTTIMYLSQMLDNLEIWDFPEPERSEFGQAVAIGTRSARKEPNMTRVPILDTMPTDEYGEANYKPCHKVPVSNKDVKIFRTQRLDPVALVAAAANSPLLKRIRPVEAEEHREARPPLPLHAGHLSLLLAAGALDGICGTGQDKHLVRGKTNKYQTISSDESYNDETGTHVKTTRKRDCYSVSIKLLRTNGEIIELT